MTKTKKAAAKKLTSAQIHKLSEQGLSQRQVAAKVGCSRSAVWSHLQK